MSKNFSLIMPVKAKPYEHQYKAYKFACEKFGLVSGNIQSKGVALLMEMGTGKTLTSIGIAGALYLEGKIKRVLVVSPLSIVCVWEQEFQRFADFPHKVTVLKGSKENKIKALEDTNGNVLQVAVVNYESAWRIEKQLLSFNPDLIIADEGHKLKEARTAQSKAMHHLGNKASYRLLLTGTVITNREIDVFSQYKFLDPNIFGDSFYAFRNKYFDMVGYGNHVPRFKNSMTNDFLMKMHSAAFRVTKEECLDLPKITEETRFVELEPIAMRLYKNLEKDSYTQICQSEVTAVNILSKLLRLSQVTGGHITDDKGKSLTVSRAKLNALSDIIDRAKNDGEKIIVMARFIAELDDIVKLLQSKKIKYSAVRGGIKNRAEEIRRFQDENDCCVFLGQIAAAGMGITLTAASTMVFYSLDYSMSNFEQAKARIHRVSQSKNCHYIYLIAKNTVDKKILYSLRHKVDLAKSLVDDYRKGIDPFK